MGPQLEALANQHPNVKLRKIDIVNWESEVARQYRVQSLPTIWLYEDGELLTRDRREIAERLGNLR